MLAKIQLSNYFWNKIPFTRLILDKFHQPGLFHLLADMWWVDRHVDGQRVRPVDHLDGLISVQINCRFMKWLLYG